MRAAWLYLVATLLMAGCASVERNYEAALLLGDIAAGDDDSKLKRRTPQPQRDAFYWQHNEREYYGALYVPGSEPQASLVLIHGLTERGVDDPRLHDFAMSLARVGFTVFVPEIESFRQLEVHADDARDVRDAVEWLLAEHPRAAAQPLGVAATSMGVGPTMLAVLDDSVAAEVDFMVSVGGYHDMTDAISYITTGASIHPRRTYRYTPNEYGTWYMLRSHAERVDSASDRELLARIAERKMADFEADVSELVAELGDDGRLVYELLSNTEPDRVAGLLERLPDAVRDELAALNLAQRDLEQLQARMLLIHGLRDNVIPWQHSRDLQAAVGDERSRFYRVRGLMHVDVRPGPVSGWRLWRAGHALLLLRDGQQTF